MKLTYAQVIAQHQNLQKTETAPVAAEHVEQVKVFIADVVAAGTEVADPRQREQLRSILRYWSAWVYDQTKEFPPSQLAPFAGTGTGGTRNLNLWLAVGAVVVIAIALAMYVLLIQPSQQATQRSATATAAADIATAAQIAVEMTLTSLPTDTPVIELSQTPSIIVASPTVPPALTETPIPTDTPAPTATPLREAGYLFTLNGNTDDVFTMVFNSDSKLLVSGSRDGFIRVWEIGGAPVPRTFRQVEVIFALAFDGGGSLVSAGGGGVLRFWDVTNGRLLDEKITPNGNLTSLAFGSGNIFASGSVPDSADSTLPTIRLWDAVTRNNLAVFDRDPVMGLAVTLDDKRVIAAGTNGTIRVWDVQTGNKASGPVFVGHKGVIWSLVLSPDGQQLASAGQDGAIRIWDMTTGKLLKELASQNPVFALAYSPDGKLLASGGADQLVHFWKASDFSEVGKPLAGHTGSIRSVAFNPTIEMLASGSTDNTIIVWSVPSVP